MKTSQVKKKYKNEWVLGEVIKENEASEPIDVEIITHSKNRDDIYNALQKVKSGKHVTTLYTGEIPKKGYAVAF